MKVNPEFPPHHSRYSIDYVMMLYDTVMHLAQFKNDNRSQDVSVTLFHFLNAVPEGFIKLLTFALAVTQAAPTALGSAVRPARGINTSSS